MDYVYDTFMHNGYQIEIIQDESADNPIQETDDMVKVVMWHRNYAFGNCDDFKTPEDFEDYCKDHKIHRLPLYLYDHNGCTVSTGPFYGSWDSGQIGWVFVTDEDAKENLYPDDKETAEPTYNKTLKATVGQLDDYLRGNVWGYVVKKLCPCCGNAKNVVDSCWGFYGDPEGYVLEEAKACVPKPSSKSVLAI